MPFSRRLYDIKAHRMFYTDSTDILRSQYLRMYGTGLRDKTGWEIFEGDLLLTEYGDTVKVLWDTKRAAFMVDGPFPDHYLHYYAAKSYIIGYMYEEEQVMSAKYTDIVCTIPIQCPECTSLLRPLGGNQVYCSNQQCQNYNLIYQVENYPTVNLRHIGSRGY